MPTDEKWVFDFVDMGNLSIGDLTVILVPIGHNGDIAKQIVEQLELVQRFCTTDVKSIPAVEIDNLLSQFRAAVIVHLLTGARL